MIEMTLVLPIFFMLLFGVFKFSIILFGRGNAIYAANVAARYAAVHSSTSVVPSTTASVQAYATPYLFAAPNPGTTVTPTYSAGNNVGSTVTVTVDIVYPAQIPFYGGSSITVRGTALRTVSR